MAVQIFFSLFCCLWQSIPEPRVRVELATNHIDMQQSVCFAILRGIAGINYRSGSSREFGIEYEWKLRTRCRWVS
ncbi:unnamed protein product [Onchocerca flexuosa]|uniref:Secreted protein n=1 Tax=Onchocerca flexuosa TaxID=387005 RepID=A0A183I6A9_9BILA|nr:unnamed protein product [Onchocerca flexuosa]